MGRTMKGQSTNAISPVIPVGCVHKNFRECNTKDIIRNEDV